MRCKEIHIPVSQDLIQADLYGDFENLNNNCVIMAHGLAGEKQCGLQKFAEFYASLGYRVCVFDHRGFGLSTGPIKNLVDKNSQIQDWKAVIDYLKHTYNCTNQDIILWGYSFSGAHVLTLASEHAFKGIIANFPHVDGLASLTVYPKKYLLPATYLALQDLAYATVGKVKTMPVVAKNRFAVLAGADCYAGYYSLIPDHLKWDNAVPARIIASIGLYRPTTIVAKINCPILLTGACRDSLIPIQATRKMAEKNRHIRYLEHDCGHFDLFHAPHSSELLAQHQDFLTSLS